MWFPSLVPGWPVVPRQGASPHPPARSLLAFFLPRQVSERYHEFFAVLADNLRNLRDERFQLLSALDEADRHRMQQDLEIAGLAGQVQHMREQYSEDQVRDPGLGAAQGERR